MVTVFITADLDERISNICKRRNCSEEEARKLISDKESTRSSYYNYYTGKTWGDSASYDLCVNTSRLGMEGTKEFIADFIRRRMKQQN
jgi:cytidylate kinase